MPTTLLRSTIDSPLGPILLIEDDRGRVRWLDWFDATARFERLWPRHRGPATELVDVRASAAASTLVRYFAGELDALDRLDVHTNGTAFQQQVWSALRHIPHGQTRSYAQLAAAIGRPSAVRAVAAANGANPVSLINPCHRVIGSDGSLTGYAGGLERKAWLLGHERSTGTTGQLL